MSGGESVITKKLDDARALMNRVMKPLKVTSEQSGREEPSCKISAWRVS